MTRVKICGLSSTETLDAALDAGADFIGLVHFAKSPRHVSLSPAAELAARIKGRAASVVLLVDPDDDVLRAVCEQVSPDFIQLHGHETPERSAAVKALTRCPVIKAVSVATPADVATADAYVKGEAPAADLVLFDAKPPADATLPGGNGLAFDWRILDNLPPGRDFALAGGLTAQNVCEAVRLTRAPIVDVSSGVESAPGMKSPDLIASFICAAKTATSA